MAVYRVAALVVTSEIYDAATVQEAIELFCQERGFHSIAAAAEREGLSPAEYEASLRVDELAADQLAECVMAENSKIEWTDHTFNPWIGCQKVSPGCDHCYAEAMMDHRLRKVQWGLHGERKRNSEAYWRLPYRWVRQARKMGTRPRIFCASLADVFDNQVPRQWRGDLFDLIAATPELDWLLLTKRPENIRKMLPADWERGYPNVWLGTTTEDQEHYNRRWPLLATLPARVRFVSYEPALGPLRLFSSGIRPDWIICGGESGRGARYMPAEWARDLRDECEVSGIAFFMKQMTRKTPIPPDLMVRQFPNFPGLRGSVPAMTSGE